MWPRRSQFSCSSVSIPLLSACTRHLEWTVTSTTQTHSCPPVHCRCCRALYPTHEWDLCRPAQCHSDRYCPPWAHRFFFSPAVQPPDRQTLIDLRRFLTRCLDIYVGGIYVRPQEPSLLLQYLNSYFASNVAIRKQFVLERNETVQFTASCFCHDQAIDIGFACSTCLSIFCTSRDTCSVCGEELRSNH